MLDTRAGSRFRVVGRPHHILHDAAQTGRYEPRFHLVDFTVYLGLPRREQIKTSASICGGSRLKNVLPVARDPN